MDQLIEDIKKYVPFNEQEENDKRLMLEYCEMYKDVLTRENETMHFTTSAWIVNKDRTKVLMIYHNTYDSWAWVGGHADGDADLRNVIRKEIEEETGITDIKFLQDGIYGIYIVTVDGHVKRGKYVSSHLHLDCEFLIEANEEDEIRIKEDENSGVKWIPLEDAPKITKERKMVPIYQNLNEKLKGIK